MASSSRSINIASATAYTTGLFQLSYASKLLIHDAFENRVKSLLWAFCQCFMNKFCLVLFFPVRFVNGDQVSAPPLRAGFPICFANKESTKLTGNWYFALERGSPMVWWLVELTIQVEKGAIQSVNAFKSLITVLSILPSQMLGAKKPLDWGPWPSHWKFSFHIQQISLILIQFSTQGTNSCDPTQQNTETLPHDI